MRAERFAAVASRLGCTLGRCGETPDVGAIHHVRTGSRRLDAALDALERETSESEAMRKSAVKLRKLLKKVRRRAGKVRDLDVHRGLLRKLTPELDSDPRASRAGDGSAGSVLKQAEDLDAELERRRGRRAEKFRQRACRWQGRLDQRVGAVLQAAAEAGDPPANAGAAELALESFAGLCREIPVLDTGTLHDFRKGAKHARYIAEGGDDDWSKRTAQRLKRVQDAIGMWHDWLVLATEAQEAAGGERNELVERMESRRDRQFRSAMKTTERVREELLGEWEDFAKQRVGRGADGAGAGLAKTA